MFVQIQSLKDKSLAHLKMRISRNTGYVNPKSKDPPPASSGAITSYMTSYSGVDFQVLLVFTTGVNSNYLMQN